MMLEKELVDVRISNGNRLYYENLLNVELKNFQIITITQSQLQKTSKIKVKCTCDDCGIEVIKVRANIKKDVTCKECWTNRLRNRNPNPPKEKIKVSCEICNKEFKVFESVYKKNKFHHCSRECYAQFRSVYYVAENNPSYDGDAVIKRCDNDECENEMRLTEWYLENKKHNFCSQDCYYSHRKKYYTEFYSSIDNLNNSRKETKPERMVREWLELKNVEYYQEYPLGKYYLDFYIPSQNKVIEVYGDYWHANPKIYNENGREVTDIMKERRKSDARKEGYIKHNKLNLHIVWEGDLYDDLEKEMNKIFQ